MNAKQQREWEQDETVPSTFPKSRSAEVAELRAEVEHWKHHAWEAGEGFKRAIRAEVKAHAGRRAAEERLRKVEALAETVFLAHGPDVLINSREQWVSCICDENLPCLIEDGYPNEDAERAVRAKHVAAALMAALAPSTSPAEQEGGRG